MQFNEGVLLTLPRFRGNGVIRIHNELTSDYPFLGWVLIDEDESIVFDSALHGYRYPARSLVRAVESANSYDEHLFCEEFSELLTAEEKSEIILCQGVLTDDQREVLKSDVAKALLSFNPDLEERKS